MSVAFTTLTPYQSVSGLITISFAVSDNPHHLQLEWRVPNGFWERAAAWNRVAPYTLNFNTWAYANGTYELRVREYSNEGNDTFYAEAYCPIVIANPAGTVRDYVGGVDLISTAIAAASNGDTIRLTGVFPDEGASKSVNKRVKMIAHPSATSMPQIATRLRSPGSSAGRVYQGLMFTNSAQSVISSAGTGDVFQDCIFDNQHSTTSVGMDVGESFDFNGIAADPKFERCTFRNNGDAVNNSSYSPFHIHGIYIEQALRPFLINCIAYNNSGRSYQMYPNCNQGVIYKCVAYASNMAVVFGGDVGEATSTTLTAIMNAGDTTATVGATTNWPASGILMLRQAGVKTEYVSYTTIASGTSVTGIDPNHTAFAIGNTVDIYVNSNYCKVERSIMGLVGTEGGTGIAGRSSGEAMFFGFWGSGSPLGTPPKGVGNVVINNFLHDPALAGLGAGKYFDVTADANHMGFITVDRNQTGTSPGYTDPNNGNFKLTYASPAVGYGPDSIQPDSLLVSDSAPNRVIVPVAGGPR